MINKIKEYFKRPKYFDFTLRFSRRRVVYLRDLISTVITALATVIYKALGWIGLTGVGWAQASVTIATVVVKGAIAVGSSLLSTALTSQNKQKSLSTGGILLNSSMITDPIRPIYGKVRVGASRVFVHATEEPINKFLHVICVWGEGEINRIAQDGLGDMIWIGEKRIQEFEAVHGRTWVWHTFYSGTENQNIDATLQGYFSEWQDAMRGTSYSYFRLLWNSSLWAAFPEFTAVVEGRKIFDTRDGSISYSRNPALVLFDFMTHPIYGGGIPGYLFDIDSVNEAANWFDANLYYFDGAIADRQEFLENINDIMFNSRLECIWTGGTYKIIVKRYTAPVASIDERDIQADQSRMNSIGLATVGIQEIPKQIKITYSEAVDNYQPGHAYYPEFKPGETETDLETKEYVLIGTTSYVQAMKMAKFYYLLPRYSTSFNVAVHPRLLGLELNDMISVSRNTDFEHSSIPDNWTNKILRVTGLSILPNNLLGLQLTDEDASVYDDTVNSKSRATYKTYLPGRNFTPGMPTNLEATTGEDIVTVSKEDAYIEFSWDSLGPGIHYEIRYRRPNEPKWHKIQVRYPGGEISIPEKEGSGTLKMEAGGNYSGDINRTYRVEIDGIGTPNTFKWSDNNGISWNETGKNVSTNWIKLNYDVKIKFSSTTGGTIGLYWTFLAEPSTRISVRKGGFPCGVTYSWQVRGEQRTEESDWATPDTMITTWSPPQEAINIGDVVLTATSQAQIVLLKWTKSNIEPNLHSWLIYRNTTNDPETAVLLDEKSRNTKSYRDTKVVRNTTYWYWLRIEDRAGNLTDFSTPATITHKNRSRALTLEQETEIPQEDGTLGFYTDAVPLHNCDSLTNWTHTSSVSGSINLSLESSDVKEGSGAVKAVIYRYPSRSEVTTGTELFEFGRTSDKRFIGQRFILSASTNVKAIALKVYRKGSPGNITAEIYTEYNLQPHISLGSATILSSNVPSNSFNPEPYDYIYAVFSSEIALTGNTYYWIVFSVPSTSYLNYYVIQLRAGDTNPFLHFRYGSVYYLENGMITYDMNYKVCIQGDALNKYIYVPISPANISDKTYYKSWVKASRTGTFLQHCFGEGAITEQAFNITHSTAYQWEFKSSNISGISGSSRDAVAYIGYRITNLDQDLILWFDSIFSNAADPVAVVYQEGSQQKLLTDKDLFNPRNTSEFFDDFISVTFNSEYSTSILTNAVFSIGVWIDSTASASRVSDVNGVIQAISTSGVAAFFYPYDANNFLTAIAKDPTLVMGLRPAGTATTAVFYRGFTGTHPPTAGAPTNGIYFRHTGISGNFFAVCRSGGSETAVDTGIAAATGTTRHLKISVINNGGSVVFFIDETVVATITSNIPSVNMRPALWTSIQAGQTVGMRLDYIYLKSNR